MSVEDLARHARRVVLGAAWVLALRADECSCVPEYLVGVDSLRAASTQPHLPWRAMLHTDVLASLGRRLERDPAPSPGRGDRMAAVLAPFVLEPEPALIFTVRAAAFSRHAGEISFPGGLAGPGRIAGRDGAA